MSFASQIFALNFMGILWGFIGMNLLRKGIPPIFLSLSPKIAILMILFAVSIGCFKSIFLIKKTAERLVKRVDLIQGPSTLFKIFDKKAVIFLALMMTVSFSIRFVPGLEIAKSFIRTAVGYALLQSSVFFFKPLFLKKIEG